MEVRATGGSVLEGYKWLDIQFSSSKDLIYVRNKAVDIFCPYHKGVLTRMNDDIASFNDDQKEQIKKCGVIYSNYIPHITTWYIDLPLERKVVELENIAEEIDVNNLSCYAESIALVELGRNGNVTKILDQHAIGKKPY